MNHEWPNNYEVTSAWQHGCVKRNRRMSQRVNESAIFSVNR